MRATLMGLREGKGTLPRQMALQFSSTPTARGQRCIETISNRDESNVRGN